MKQKDSTGLIKIAEEFKNRNIDDSFIGDKIEDFDILVLKFIV